MMRKDRCMRAPSLHKTRVISSSKLTVRLLAMASGVAGLLLPGEAQAALTGDFAAKLDVDSTWLSGANGATDIAFASDGRAVVTTRTGQIVVRLTDGTKKTTEGQFPTIDNSFQEKGLTGVVADPTTPNRFFFYVDDG